MTRKQRIAVFIKGPNPDQEEKDLIEKLGNPLVCNSQFFAPTQSERVFAYKVYNLSGREDIDEFYSDILEKKEIKISPSKVQEPKEATSNIVEEVTEEAPVEETKPRRGRPKK